MTPPISSSPVSQNSFPSSSNFHQQHDENKFPVTSWNHPGASPSLLEPTVTSGGVSGTANKATFSPSKFHNSNHPHHLQNGNGKNMKGTMTAQTAAHHLSSSNNNYSSLSDGSLGNIDFAVSTSTHSNSASTLPLQQQQLPSSSLPASRMETTQSPSALPPRASTVALSPKVTVNNQSPNKKTPLLAGSTNTNPTTLRSAPGTTENYPSTTMVTANRCTADHGSVASGADITSSWPWETNNDPDDEEQALFEQRLCEDVYGVAVRKINQNGKSNLRYVRCYWMTKDEYLDMVDNQNQSGNRSVSSRSRSFSRRFGGGRERSLERSEASTTDRSDPRWILSGLRGAPPLSTTTTNAQNGGYPAAGAHAPAGTAATLPLQQQHQPQKVQVMTWGKKKDIKIPVSKFTAVRKGKTTDRARRNVCPASRILSLITDDPRNASLDIEAPTRLDRDKFARAFSRFLKIPMEGDDVRDVRSIGSGMTPHSATAEKRPPPPSNAEPKGQHPHFSAAVSAPQNLEVVNGLSSANNSHATNNSNTPRKLSFPFPVVDTKKNADANGTSDLPNRLPPPRQKQPPSRRSTPEVSSHSAPAIASKEVNGPEASTISDVDMPILSRAASSSRPTSTEDPMSEISQPGTPEMDFHADHEDASFVSSITGGGYDQEIVEELHMALTELRVELEESRAEAARAVKVAEQAIQSAENSNSKDWNSTVTHKAAEAAALAQKKSAEAMAKARLAEERLEAERKNANMFRKQAQVAEEEAGHWVTRAAAAEVQRAAMAEALESERQKAHMLVDSMQQRFASTGAHQKGALESTMERNHALELELEVMRTSLQHKSAEVATLQEFLEDAPMSAKWRSKSNRKKADVDRDGAARALLSVNSMLSNAVSGKGVSPDDLLRVHTEFQTVRKQFDMLKKATSDELNTLPDSAKIWAEQASQAVLASQSEIERLQTKLAMESASRRKLLSEVQDLRGSVRVYCRTRGSSNLISAASQEVLLLHREKVGGSPKAANGSNSNSPLSFEFDGILSDVGQQELYDEMEEVCLSVMDGYNVCIMSYGQTGSGKTYTMLGDVKYQGNEVSIQNYGIHLRAVQQFFSVMKHRSERYQHAVTFNVVEVHNERICDLLAGTEIGDTIGKIEGSSTRGGRSSVRKRLDSADGTASHSSSKPNKLEIKTSRDGETMVHGLISVEASNFNDVLLLWKECLLKRAIRLGGDLAEHETNSHVISTITVKSTNTTTGVTTSGKIQFVDLASSHVLPKPVPSSGSSSRSKKSQQQHPDPMMAGVGNSYEWKFGNKSMVTLNEVVTARSQFHRVVPYRNSTITHLLSDSLEADTKVVLVACVNSDPKDLQQTACTLKFAQKMRKVVIGKATKHTSTEF